jgi:hypothetical protein
MNNNKSNDPKAVNWKCLPEPATLLEYLNRNDVIELGKCCKQFRKQFAKDIFEKLNLTLYLNKNKAITEELKKSKNYDKLAKVIKEDLGEKLNLIKIFNFIDLFCIGVVDKVVELIPNINTIVFNLPYCWDCRSHSLTFLKGIKNLEYVEYKTYQPEFRAINLKDAVFPKSLKSIKLIGYEEYLADICVFDNINSTYATNLSALCISTNKMLTNFTPLTSLKEVTILTEYGLERSLIVKFFEKNSQLSKIEFNFEIFDELLQIILSYKDLNYLFIYGVNSSMMQNSNYPINYSVKKLRLGRRCYGNKAMDIINSCQNLKVLIFHGMESENFDTIKWIELTPKIKTLEFRWFKYGESIIAILDALQLFDQIKFTECTNFLDLKSFKAIKLNNYTLNSLIGYPVYYSMKLMNKP